MLILTRRVGETIVIDKEITVTVLAINNGQVRFGCCAPKDVDIHREEIQKKIERGVPWTKP